jgi:hypothetical protein
MQNLSHVKALFNKVARKSASLLPRRRRYRVFRSLVRCDLHPDQRLEVKIAETQDEFEACYRLLHDTYVDRGLMVRHPSGLRLTIYHALPTTTTICAKFAGKVVGTLSLIRESALGLPAQRIFDLTGVRGRRGSIAEASALAIAPQFRGSGGAILFPLMKFMYEYCANFTDTRHLLIAVHPRHIEMYEGLFLFRRLTGKVVVSYDYVNGAPAVGATLDLRHAPEIFRRYYGGRPLLRNLHHYFMEAGLPNLRMPQRRISTADDPAMAPALLDYFFNRQAQVFAKLDGRRLALMHLIYDRPEYRRLLPALPPETDDTTMRSHRRFPIRCPGQLISNQAGRAPIAIELSEVSRYGFRARASEAVPDNIWMSAEVRVGRYEITRLLVMATQSSQLGGTLYYGFAIGEPDLVWRKFVNGLYDGRPGNDPA